MSLYRSGMSGAEWGPIVLFVLCRSFLYSSLLDWCCVLKGGEGSVVVCDGEFGGGGGGSVSGCCGRDGDGGRRWREVERAFGERNCVLGGLRNGSTVRWETRQMRRERGGKRVEWVDPSFSQDEGDSDTTMQTAFDNKRLTRSKLLLFLIQRSHHLPLLRKHIRHVRAVLRIITRFEEAP